MFLFQRVNGVTLDYHSKLPQQFSSSTPAYALAPWGMQPNTSPWRMSAATCAVLGPCLCLYYTIFGNFWVTSCGRRSGKKSILRALASFAAVRKEMLTSWCSTFVIYGRETCIRFASSVCDTPSSFIRSRMRRRNAEPILSIAVNGICRVVSFNAEAQRRRGAEYAESFRAASRTGFAWGILVAASLH